MCPPDGDATQAAPDSPTLRPGPVARPAPDSATLQPGAATQPAPDSQTLRVPVQAERAPEEGPAGWRHLGRTAGRYVDEGEIGRGGMGAVFRAFDRDLRRQVAMKVTLHDFAGHREVAERFVEEAQATAQLQHPGIVPVYDIGLTDEGKLYFTMKLVRGRTLAEVIREARAGDPETAREFTPFRLLQVFVEIARAVGYAHERGLVHRDLKPQNVMLGRHGEVQVMDWGLAKVLARAEEALPAGGKGAAPPPGEAVKTESGRHETLAGAIVGTPAYMPPEQARGDLGRVGPHSDIYSLGATLFHILTGRPPFEGEATNEIVARVIASEPPRPRAHDGGVPREVEAICLKAMAKDPGKRYASADELADDVQAYLEGRPVAAYPEGIAGRAIKWAKRHRTVAATVAGAVVLGLAGAVVALVRIEGARRLAVAEHASAVAERARAEARERDARFNLERVHYERAIAALAANDARTAEVLFAKALTLEEKQETRERVIQARAKGVRLAWTAQGDPEELAVAFSPDGARLATGGRDGAIRIRDAETGREVAVLSGHEEAISALDFSPDGRSLASASTDGTARVWDLERSQERLALRGHGDRVWDAAWSPDGGRLVTAGLDRTVRLWDAKTGKELRVLRGHEDEVACVAFDPAGGRIASASWDTTVRVWDAKGGAELLRLEGHDSWVIAVAFSPDGRLLASTGSDQTIQLWDAAAGKNLGALTGHESAVYGLAFSPDGRWLASSSPDSGVRLWDLWQRKRAFFVAQGHRAGSEWTAVAFSPDGRRLASAGLEHRVHVWSIEPATRDAELVVALSGHEREIWTVAFSPDGRRLASASQDGTARVWDVGTGRAELVLRHEGKVADAAFSPDGRRLASGGSDWTVRIWDAATGAEVAALRGHEGDVNAVRFSPDGRRLASAGGEGDRTLRLWDAGTGKELRVLRHEEPVMSVAFSPDGRLVASGARAIGLWEVETGRAVATLSGHEAEVDVLNFSPDGRRLASTSWDRTGRIWDVETGRELRILRGHENWVLANAFTPDGRRIVSAGEDQTVRIWDVETGAQLVTLRGHGGNVIGVAVSPDGRRLATAGYDRRVRIWSLSEIERILAAPPKDLLAEAERRTGLRVEGLDIVPFAVGGE